MIVYFISDSFITLLKLEFNDSLMILVLKMEENKQRCWSIVLCKVCKSYREEILDKEARHLSKDEILKLPKTKY